MDKCPRCDEELHTDYVRNNFEDNNTGKTMHKKVVFEWCSECGYEYVYTD